MIKIASLTLLAAMLLAVAIWAMTPGLARPEEPQPGHDLYHHFYKHWWNREGGHCCNETHCRPLAENEARWDAERQRWQVLINGAWRDMEDSRYVKDDGGLGPFGTICRNEIGHVYCFDPPDPQM